VEPNIYCDTFQLLAGRFSVNARLYAEAVVRLTTMQRMEPEEYARLREAAHQAQELAEQAGVAFEQHVAAHKCTATREFPPHTPVAARRSVASG
jgi:hypothetical protein